ncbi:hypothetical protein M2347_001629 [Chryseobacterium sp. H1D6B]|uniref:hypothetical protein n=1 Tax=Chryseobacterium sp. H1D6B TaxID=2940588 RepID=UPI0015C75984|nr:hypothetical protein [Chryseobacterium sp. H1D6B]MDH6251902.1 hypothetical protein [Chryseobacterium sp. H1D6B]
MKKLFYFILLLAGISSIHSCKELLDEDGNPLIDLNNNTGLNGPRALYREITDADTIAEYHYNGLLLSNVIGKKKKSATNVMYSGNLVSKITYNGFLDKNDGTMDTDSTAYTQLFTYNNSGRLESIAETRQVYSPGTGTPPGPFTLTRKTKTLYNLKYVTATSKLDSIIMRTGEDTGGGQFAYTNYSKTAYQYLGDNISKVIRHYGPMTNGVMGNPVSKYGYEFLNYDNQISPYTLIPTAYKISVILSTEANDVRSLMLSPNSPQRYSVTDLTLPIPAPAIFTTNYSYDPQTYMIRGYGVNYFYKPL